MNEVIPGIGYLEPSNVRALAEYLGPNATREQSAGIRNAIDPERQYADMSVYEAPGYKPAWEVGP